MKIHLIAIGGAVMHNVALELKNLGHAVSGSDDDIFDPAKSRLREAGILPEEMGWFPNKITPDLDFVILGMHARADNPELKKADEIGLKIYSFPEFVFEQAKNKTRVVIGGSHGKTTTTAIIMHVLKHLGKDFDYLVGSKLEGFDTMVRFSEAPLTIIEGDEYLTSPIDRKPKFLWYKPQIVLLTGIAWDHINVFPTFENYLEQFQMFVNELDETSFLACYSGDPHLKKITENAPCKVQNYDLPENRIENGKAIVSFEDREYPLSIFGVHNLNNLEGARVICAQLGISGQQFWEAASSFKGAANRLELIKEQGSKSIYRDFAHSPSKLKATVDAVKNQFPERKVIAVFELHTFSSLSRDFLVEFKGCMASADVPIVFFNRHVFEWKKMPSLDESEVSQAFGNVAVFTETERLHKALESHFGSDSVMLLMSSGNFNKMEIDFLN